MTALYFWIFTSKWIKLLGHYLRYPVDVLLLPVSVLFGYFHGAIKMYAVMTLNVVSLQSLSSFSHVLLFSLLFRAFFPLSAGRAYMHPSAAPPFPVFSPFAYDSSASQRFDHCLLLRAVHLLPHASLAARFRSCIDPVAFSTLLH